MEANLARFYLQFRGDKWTRKLARKIYTLIKAAFLFILVVIFLLRVYKSNVYLCEMSKALIFWISSFLSWKNREPLCI